MPGTTVATYPTTAEAKRAALATQTARQCATGRHVRGCPHRPATAAQQPQGAR